jgi:hypothetical protein
MIGEAKILEWDAEGPSKSRGGIDLGRRGFARYQKQHNTG